MRGAGPQGHGCGPRHPRHFSPAPRWAPPLCRAQVGLPHPYEGPGDPGRAPGVREQEVRGARQGYTGTSQLAEATQAVPLSQYGADAPRDPPAQPLIRLRHTEGTGPAHGHTACRWQAGHPSRAGRAHLEPGAVVHGEHLRPE